MATNFFFQHPTSFLHQGRPLRIQFRSSPTNLYKLVTLYFYLYTIQNVHSHQVHILNPQRNVAVSVYTLPTATRSPLTHALMIDTVRLPLAVGSKGSVTLFLSENSSPIINNKQYN